MLVWSSLHSSLRDKGPMKSAWLALRYALKKTIGLDWIKEIIVERALEEPVQTIVPAKDVVIKQANVDDIFKLNSLVNPQKYQLYQKRNDKGIVCFIALEGDKVIAYSWIKFTSRYQPKKSIPDNKVAYLYDSFVSPKYRNKRLHSALTAARLQYLRQRGYLKVLTAGQKDNPSFKTMVQAGFKPTKTVLLFTVFKLQFRLWHKISAA